jgi:hypothetical protein
LQVCSINFHAWNRLAAPALIRGKSCWILLTATENDGRHAAPNTMMSGMQQQLANAMMGGNTTRQCNDGGIQIIG